MIGKASEIKTKVVFPVMRNNPDWDANRPASTPRYLVRGIDEELNSALEALGEAEIISIQYQMSAYTGDSSETALIIYKESKQSVYENRGMRSL